MSMFILIYYLLHLLLRSDATIANSIQDISPRFDCPTWYTPVWNNTVSGKIKCLANEKVSMLEGKCMTYTGNETLIGACSYLASNSTPTDDIFTTLPQNVSELNEFMCGWNNRTGLLCSQCKSGLSLAALS